MATGDKLVTFDMAKALNTKYDNEISALQETVEGITGGAVTDIYTAVHRAGQNWAINYTIDKDDIVYIETNAPAGKGYRIYLSDGVSSPHPQNSDKLSGHTLCSLGAKMNYVKIYYWFDDGNTEASVHIYKTDTVSQVRKIAECKYEKVSTLSLTGGKTTTVHIPFQCRQGDVIYVCVGDLVTTTHQHFMAGFSDGVTAAQMVTANLHGPTKLIANTDYNYICLWVSPTALVSANIKICQSSEKDDYTTYSVLGDSYSAYTGYIPSGNNPAYPMNDVTSVDEMWWKIYGDGNGMTADLIEAWSGSPVCNWCWEHDTSGNSFVTRVKNLPESDVIFVFGGTNDSYGSATLGDYVYSNWTAEQLKTFRPAYAYVLSYLQAFRPRSRVVAVLNNGINADIIASMKEIAAHYDVPIIELANIGKTQDHPNVAGMASIADQINMVMLGNKKRSNNGNVIALSEQLISLASGSSI